ncbi:DODA-type extradiol aromatic ring-opening family dioxygenase [Comamonas testosteroni]|uniref:DODA-type extradiol aromatic ring-opening family dioxygenase n=1 Tax=Comamonas testosteroni TaxID=285 RepID=UPI001E45C39E|nr:class III extradiol ring-cleavage dioxygenase [Comamonas testosteroni]
MVSLHWRTRSRQVGCSVQPETIHDFGGFPAPLYALQYPAKGAPEVAREVADHLVQVGMPIQLNRDQGLDHGAWVPLMHILPGAALPVFQL